MNTNRTASIFDRFASRDDFLGFGYIGERRSTLEAVATGEAGPQLADQVALADRAVLQFAAENAWSDEDLFAWGNSKDGRWFADVLFGGCGSDSFHALLKRASRYLVRQTAR